MAKIILRTIAGLSSFCGVRLFLRRVFETPEEEFPPAPRLFRRIALAFGEAGKEVSISLLSYRIKEPGVEFLLRARILEGSVELVSSASCADVGLR